ncbi:MAG: starch-binding protein, partial [Bacteroidia bacterium]|nr:starch-binding protein [Bacteroidia bacterium]
MNTTRKLLLLLSVLALWVPMSRAQNTDVLLQGFNWESHGNTIGWYNVIKSKATDLSASGIDMVWFPPASDAGDIHGYLPRELYVMNSNYGTQAQLVDAINTLHANNIKAVADIVINHRVGSSNWADFQNPTWGCWAVTAQDEWGSNGGNPCGNWDTGDNYSAARDIDHTNQTVRSDLIAWMNWLKGTIGFDGWRYDYVRGYSGYYNSVYNNATNPYFSVGELWDNLDLNNTNPHRQQIINWIDATQGTSSAFDFTTKGILQQAVNGELWRLSYSGVAPGVIGWYPSRAVTFIDNHDTGSTQNYWPFPGGKVMQGYAYILTHPGVPAVFWDHFYDWGLHDAIRDLIQIRKNNGIHNTSTLDIKVAQGNLYAAEIDGKVAMKIGPGSWSPSGTGWTLAASGNDYAVWEKAAPACNDNLTLHFKKPAGWSTATMYFWNPTPSGPATTWPGVTMTNDGNGWYSYTLPCASCTNVIFSDNGANQSANLYRCNEGWYNGTWHNTNPDNNSSAGLTVHFQPTSYSNPNIYFWGVTPTNQTTTWPGVSMTSEGNGWWKYTFAGASCANFIFSNNGANQSPDLTSCSEVWITEGNWPAYKNGGTTAIGDELSPSLVTAFPNPADDNVQFQFLGDLRTDASL